MPSTIPVRYSLYIHIPFCRTRCTYCAFNTYSGMETLIPAYVDALCAESEIVGKHTGAPIIHTVYFGGGTPSLLAPSQVAILINSFKRHFQVVPEAEITLEVNPTCVDTTYFEGVRDAGINRISLGAQSANSDELRLFNRRHNWAEVVKTIDAIRAGGIQDYGLDLIYGAPEQTLRNWHSTLEAALGLEPSHLSLYSLSLEEGTPLHRRNQLGEIDELDSDLVGDMYDHASGYLESAGYVQYEISNWARPGHECLHNLQYWRRKPYLALGAGAYGFYGEMRYGNVDSPARYIELIQNTNRLVKQILPAQDTERTEYLSETDARTETMILGLRLLNEGVIHSEFESRFGAPIESFYGDSLVKLEDRGLVTNYNGRTTLTRQARLIANMVFREFV